LPLAADGAHRRRDGVITRPGGSSDRRRPWTPTDPALAVDGGNSLEKGAKIRTIRRVASNLPASTAAPKVFFSLPPSSVYDQQQ